MRVPGRFILASAAGLLILFMGVLAAMVLAGFAVLERGAPPGNRFLVRELILMGTLIRVPLSIAAACWVLLGPTSHSSPVLPQPKRLFFGPLDFAM